MSGLCVTKKGIFVSLVKRNREYNFFIYVVIYTFIFQCNIRTFIIKYNLF